MKYLLIIMSIAICGTKLHAQTFDEWFRQNKTQLLYLYKQIAALAAYDDTQNAGNGIAENGLTTIDTITAADFAQHSAHFAYLDTPSPGILSDPEITTIRNIEAYIKKYMQ